MIQGNPDFFYKCATGFWVFQQKLLDMLHVSYLNLPPPPYLRIPAIRTIGHYSANDQCKNHNHTTMYQNPLTLKSR